MNRPPILSAVFTLVIGLLAPPAPALAEGRNLLNVSYDVSREIYKDYNPIFIAHWKAATGEDVAINQSHGGSSKQARAVIDGLEADVVTMNQQTDVDALAKAGLVDADWRSALPDNSAPYTSTIVFLVRKGNPKNIRDWDDLAEPNMQVIIPNPKTSGNGRYSYLAAWGFALDKYGSDERARDFVARIFGNVPILDTGGRGATTTFVQRGIGDVLLTFENEVFLTALELSPDDFDVVIPSVSIEAEAPVAVVQSVAAKRATVDLARAYLEHLWSEEAQRVIARHYLRPRSPAVLAEHADVFKPIRLLTVDGIAGGWAQAQKTHFADGGVFDRFYESRQ